MYTDYIKHPLWSCGQVIGFIWLVGTRFASQYQLQPRVRFSKFNWPSSLSLITNYKLTILRLTVQDSMLEAKADISMNLTANIQWIAVKVVELD